MCHDISLPAVTGHITKPPAIALKTCLHKWLLQGFFFVCLWVFCFFFDSFLAHLLGI